MIVLKYLLQLARAQYTQSWIAADAVFCDSQLTTDVFASTNNDCDDPFLNLDDNEDELEAKNSLFTVRNKQCDSRVWVRHSNCTVQDNFTRPHLVFAVV